MRWCVLDSLKPGDATEAAALSAAFGWPHRPADWDAFLQLGQGVACRREGRLVGTAMWFALDDSHASISLVQVAPEMQGRGLGRRLMQAVMEDAAGRSLKLHATLEGAGLYASLGFAAGGIVEQWQGITDIAAGAVPGIRVATPEDRAAIGRLDQAATGLDRALVLDALMHNAVIAVAGPPGAVAGFVVRRLFGRGALVGPLVAPDEATAIALAEFVAEPGFLRMELPGAPLKAWATACGLACVGRVQTMTTGDWPAPTAAHTRMALASQAFG
jgi:GNAT superfamily N-acetyltransferase